MTEVTSSSSMKEEYRKHIAKRIFFIGLILVALVFLIGVALTIGGRDIGVLEVYGYLFNHILGNDPEVTDPAWQDLFSIWNVRLPRILAALIAGCGLAIGGAVMQAAVKNPLADPYTTGISSGAVFGVSVALVLGFSLSSSTGVYGLIINAFIFGMIPAAFVIVLSRFSTVSPTTIILAGVALSYLFSSLSTLLLIGSSAETIQQAYVWQIGTLQNVNWNTLPVMFLVTLIGGVISLIMSNKLNLLTLGDASAKSLGLNAEQLRLIILILLSVMTAGIISYTGIIGFVGLVSPHIVRMILGADNRFVIPGSALVGMLLLALSDLIARTIIYPGEIAVGVIMSFIGAPIFLLLIIRSRKEMW